MPELTWKSIVFLTLILVLSVGGCSSDLSEAQVAFREGTDLLQQPHLESAIRAFDKAIQLDPSFSVAYYSRGYAYGELGQHERAIQDYDKGIQLDTNDAIAYYNRAYSYQKIGFYPQSDANLAKACSLDNKYC